MGVVELKQAFESGVASLMVRPLASISEREVLPTDVHRVDNRNRTLGASPKWARSGSRRLERRYIKAEIDAHLFYHIEATVPTIQNPLWHFANLNLRTINKFQNIT